MFFVYLRYESERTYAALMCDIASFSPSIHGCQSWLPYCIVPMTSREIFSPEFPSRTCIQKNKLSTQVHNSSFTLTLTIRNFFRLIDHSFRWLSDLGHSANYLSRELSFDSRHTYLDVRVSYGHTNKCVSHVRYIRDYYQARNINAPHVQTKRRMPLTCSLGSSSEPTLHPNVGGLPEVYISTVTEGRRIWNYKG